MIYEYMIDKYLSLAASVLAIFADGSAMTGGSLDLDSSIFSVTSTGGLTGAVVLLKTRLTNFPKFLIRAVVWCG